MKTKKIILFASGVLLCLVLYYLMPRYRLNSNDRVQLIYQDVDGHPALPPMYQYIGDLLIPERAIMSLGVTACMLTPESFLTAALSPAYLGRGFKQEQRDGNLCKFYLSYLLIDKTQSFPMSGCCSQICNMFWAVLGVKGMRTQALYVIRPKHFDKNKSYPVVFFCHGMLGNWKLYQGVLSKLDDCIVVSYGTKDWSGCYSENDISEIWDRHIPFLRELGYSVDTGNVHLMGLSNGGSAAQIAHASGKFKSVTYISTWAITTSNNTVVNLIGGADCSGFPNIHSSLKASGNKGRMLYDSHGTHYMLVTEMDECVEFLNSLY